MVKDPIFLTEKDGLLQNVKIQLAEEIEESVVEHVGNGQEVLSLIEILTGYKFYFFVLLCAVNIYRIRYFLGIAGYTLQYLRDTGTYLELLGYCFALSIVFGPVTDKVLARTGNEYNSLHTVNFAITAYFVTWLIPSLQVQVLTFVIFILARLLCFAVLSDYCSKEFTEKRFGFVLGSGFLAASIPGAFTYGIVDVVLEKFSGNFWAFHLMCILMCIPVSLIIYLVQKQSQLMSNINCGNRSMIYMSI